MDSPKPLAHDDSSIDSLKISLEIVANLIYLSRRAETHSALQKWLPGPGGPSDGGDSTAFKVDAD